ncbi:hypothetical protein MRX96_010361 [Rhipicephalus microplus]
MGRGLAQRFTLLEEAQLQFVLANDGVGRRLAAVVRTYAAAGYSLRKARKSLHPHDERDLLQILFGYQLTSRDKQDNCDCSLFMLCVGHHGISHTYSAGFLACALFALAEE